MPATSVIFVARTGKDEDDILIVKELVQGLQRGVTEFQGVLGAFQGAHCVSRAFQGTLKAFQARCQRKCHKVSEAFDGVTFQVGSQGFTGVPVFRSFYTSDFAVG